MRKTTGRVRNKCRPSSLASASHWQPRRQQEAMTEDWLWQWVHEQPDLTLARLCNCHIKKSLQALKQDRERVTQAHGESRVQICGLPLARLEFIAESASRSPCLPLARAMQRGLASKDRCWLLPNHDQRQRWPEGDPMNPPLSEIASNLFDYFSGCFGLQEKTIQLIEIMRQIHMHAHDLESTRTP